MPSIREQLRRHSVALISLCVAITSLAYNTWRNEASEANRNVRTAGIAMLVKLGELDRVLLHAQYGSTSDDMLEMDTETFMYRRSGWAFVLTCRDLGSVVGEPVATSTANLFAAWERDEAALGGDDASAAGRISSAIDAVRSDLLEILSGLD